MTDASSVVTKAESWIANAFEGIKALAVADGLILWNAFKTIIETLEPHEWATLEPIIVQAIEDVFNGDLADLETAVLQRAEAAGVDFLKRLDSAGLQVVLGLFVKHTTAAA